MTAPVTETVERRLWHAMCSGDSQSARALVSGQLDQGISGTALIVDLLAPAQLAVGVRWQQRAWTVADEHAASAVVDAALAGIEANTAPPSSGGPSLILACAESEWHTLPARMAAQLLRESGGSVRFLGASMPADHLREYLARLQPDALVLSATMPTSLPGAARSIEAAHDAGVPVVAGGAAFGADDSLAACLGADRWLADARAFDGWSTPEWHSGTPRRLDWAAFQVLQEAAPAAAAAYDGLLARVPAMQRMTAAQAARTRADLGHILDFLAVAVLVGDERVMRDFTHWLLQVLESRGVPQSAVRASYRALADELDPDTGALLVALTAAETVA